MEDCQCENQGCFSFRGDLIQVHCTYKFDTHSITVEQKMKVVPIVIVVHSLSTRESVSICSDILKIGYFTLISLNPVVVCWGLR